MTYRRAVAGREQGVWNLCWRSSYELCVVDDRGQTILVCRTTKPVSIRPVLNLLKQAMVEIGVPAMIRTDASFLFHHREFEDFLTFFGIHHEIAPAKPHCNTPEEAGPGPGNRRGM
jgi:hypothetical protein